MAVPIIELADDVAGKLYTATGLPFPRRYAPYVDRASVKDGKWFVFAAGDESEPKGRRVDKETQTVDLVFQQSLPEGTDAYPNPIENRPWLDARMQDVESVKSLFRKGGSLRDADFLGLSFSSMQNTPLFLPELLQDLSIFSTFVRLEFTGELSELD
ncbi:MAG: hypothetical protein ACTHK7_21915 [Aureliella sp.]